MPPREFFEITTAIFAILAILTFISVEVVRRFQIWKRERARLHNLYHVWFVPTEKGKASFGWKERRISKNPMNKEDAEEFAYLEECDDPAPDKREYGFYTIRRAA